MKSGSYIPDKGDVVWMEFSPQVGREITKRRPALVLTNKQFNRITKVVWVCPVTSNVVNRPFKIPVSVGGIKGAILLNQIKSFDWMERKAAFITKLDSKVLNDCLAKLTAILDDE